MNRKETDRILRPILDAANAALEFDGLTEHSEFVIALPSGVIRTRQKLSVKDLRNFVDTFNYGAEFTPPPERRAARPDGTMETPKDV